MRVDPGLHRQLGLTDDEYDAIEEQLGRAPSYTELAMFSVMWSEHCSYKSSRSHLQTLPTDAPHVLVGPGEGAGVIEVAPGVSVAFKIESHNHPSFVEPFNGAATGVGGIVRDILSMGARPIALLDSLRFGPLDDSRSRYLLDGVVGGISSYGNAIGVPTVGGETCFEECYGANPLVNVACLGVVEHKLMHGRAEGPGNALVLIGSTTGRDGIGGASVLASAELSDDAATKRPAVQVGDPFTEKLLIEACLELVRDGLIVGLQDLGAGGISCPASEMPAKAGTGASIDVGRVRRREPGMEAFEVMISESQERMLAVVEPDAVALVQEVCSRWGVDATVIGEVTSTGRLEVVEEGQTVAEAPVSALATGPVYERAATRPEWLDDLQSASHSDDPPKDLPEAFLALLGSPAMASRRWIWEQYDHMIFLGTVQGPGADAAVIRLPESGVAVAITVDGPGRYCLLDPYEGARLAVAEAARNVVCAGARPLAVTNCLNFGNPEKPEVMWQFAEVVRGIGDACRGLGTPVTGGNVSFYNQTGGRAIHPTPVIGMLGVLDDPESSMGVGFAADGHTIVLLGETGPGDFGGSEYAKVVNGTVAGRPPALDLEQEQSLHTVMATSLSRGLLTSAHDVSKGGLAIALGESALAGGRGFSVDVSGAQPHRELFSESPSRVLASCPPTAIREIEQLAAANGVEARVLGSIGGTKLDFGCFAVSLEEAHDVFEKTLPSFLSATIG